MDIKTLVNISARAWCLPILGHMAKGTSGRQAPLLTATGAGRTAFAQSLTHLLDHGLLERNPGHGHPLRPEFRLTPLGQKAAPVAEKILDIDLAAEQSALLRRSWTVPILSICGSPTSFAAIRTPLTPITDRALSQSLKAMQMQGLILRDADTAHYPPRTFYHAANQGQEIAKALSAKVC